MHTLPPEGPDVATSTDTFTEDDVQTQRVHAGARGARIYPSMIRRTNPHVFCGDVPGGCAAYEATWVMLPPADKSFVALYVVVPPLPYLMMRSQSAPSCPVWLPTPGTWCPSGLEHSPCRYGGAGMLTPCDAASCANGTWGVDSSTTSILLARTFDVDVKRCVRCGGRLEVRAVVTEEVEIGRTLAALGARAPPASTIGRAAKG